jgi:hypothetical protein
MPRATFMTGLGSILRRSREKPRHLASHGGFKKWSKTHGREPRSANTNEQIRVSQSLQS